MTTTTTPVTTTPAPKPVVVGGKVPVLGSFVAILIQALLMGGLAWFTNKSNPTPPPEVQGLDSTLNQIAKIQAIANALRPATPETPLAQKEPPVSTSAIVSDAVNKPSSLFGIAAIGFVGIYILSQARAGFHEVTETGRELYTEGSRVSGRATASMSGADGGPRNYSRRAKS